MGIIVAATVLLPETATSLKAAREDRLPTSFNLALRSAVASNGLTVPAASVIAWWPQRPLELGVSPGGAVLLTLSFLIPYLDESATVRSLQTSCGGRLLVVGWLDELGPAQPAIELRI